MPDAGENAAIQQKRVFTQPERVADISAPALAEIKAAVEV